MTSIVPARRARNVAIASLGLMLAHGVARASTAGGGVDIRPLLAAVALVLVGARLGGALCTRIGQPAVLGELVVGVLLGNLTLLGFSSFEGLTHLRDLELLAQIGVLFLLFGVGLESDIGQMAAVGKSAFLVATVGVVVPMVLGYYVSAGFFPGHDALTHWFVGATLSATSVGITARVLSELKRATSVEGRIILGAAVIDDVLGLIVLAVVSGVIAATDRGGTFEAWTVGAIILKSLAFLIGAIVIGRWVSKGVFRAAAILGGEGMLLTVAIAFCFGLSYLAALAGLAPIVGAFAAGLVLEKAHYQELRAQDQKNRGVEELLEPIASFLVPVFFVLMGMRVELSAFANPGVLAFAGALTLAAIAGKQACAFGVLEKGADRLAVGLGMIPRGEVGLIFAGIGAGLTLHGERVIDDAVFSAVVVMVALTTLLTPPLLVWRLRRAPRPGAPTC